MNIKNLRKDRGISQAEMANVLGITQACLCRYENNKRKIPLPIFTKIADYFNVTTDELLGRNKEDTSVFKVPRERTITEA